MKTLNEVLTWYNDEFKDSELYHNMTATVENSPWHRESSVGEHTNMVVDHYISQCEGFDDCGYAATLGLYSCIFHDSGKPAARIAKHSETRGDYFAYHGHELISARLFEDYAVKYLSDELTAEEIYKIAFMIEHHLPWDTKNTEKRSHLARTIKYIGWRAYVRVLHSDTWGRIADDADKKRAESKEWIKTFMDLVDAVEPTAELDPAVPTLYVAIGPSGCGKSSYFRFLQTHNLTVVSYSLDALRHEFYGEDYTKAYQASVDDKTFMARAQSCFSTLIKRHVDLYVDNTNLSAKRRKFYVDAAKKYGYKTVAVLMPVALDDIIARQISRGDKNVPESAVRQHYFSLQLPLLGEFDEIKMFDSNVRKNQIV